MSPPCAIWFTGLSGAGKSTLARHLEKRLNFLGYPCARIDGDEVRAGAGNNLGFSEHDRRKNIALIAHMAHQAGARGGIALVAAISPFRDARDKARSLFPDGRFIEVFVDAPLAVCESRDVKGLYRAARAGEVTCFTGLDSPYEAPVRPEVHLQTDRTGIEESIDIILAVLIKRRLIAV